jgi:hypothetical protein
MHMSNADPKDTITVKGKTFTKEREWSRRKNISPRSAARLRQRGLEYLLWNNEIYIGDEAGDDFILKRSATAIRPAPLASASHAEERPRA